MEMAIFHLDCPFIEGGVRKHDQVWEHFISAVHLQMGIQTILQKFLQTVDVMSDYWKMKK